MSSQDSNFNTFESPSAPPAPMKFDGKEVRGANVAVVSAPKGGNGKMIAIIAVIVVLVLAIIGVIIFMAGNKKDDGESSGNESSASSSSVGSTSESSAAAGTSEASAPAASEGGKITFKKPDDWGDDICAYVYPDGGKGIAEWPGEAMTNNGDGTYSYTLSEDCENPLVIFNDGDGNGKKHQYPRNKGLKFVDGKSYTNETKD